MADTLDDAIVAARERMESGIGVMLGSRAQRAATLGSVISRGRGDEVVFRELSLLSAHMAADPSTFFDAAMLVSGMVRKAVASALNACATLSDGPNAVLRWGLSSRLPPARLEDLDELLAAIRRGRFARSEVSETVRTDLLAQARRAAELLAARMSTESVAELPSISELELVVELGAEVVLELNKFQALRTNFDAQDFRSGALLRVLEAAESLLIPVITRIHGDGDRDVDAEAEGLALITALEVSVDALVRYIEPFGDLLILEATSTPEDANLVGEVVLTPVPEKARRGLVHEGTVSAHATVSKLRTVNLVPSGDWSDSTQVQQSIEVTHDENLWCLGVFTPRAKVKAMGTGTIAGEPYWPDVLDADPGSVPPEEVHPFALLASLPNYIINSGKYAYVVNGLEIDLYLSDGTAWLLVGTNVDARRNRFLVSSSSPLGSEAVPGVDTVEITRGATSRVLGIDAAGTSVGGSLYEKAFGVLLSAHVTNEDDWEVEWRLQDGAATTTDRFRTDAGSWLADMPATELVGQAVTVWQPNQQWTHRFITETLVVGDTLEIVLDEDVESVGSMFFLPRVRGLNYPGSPYIRMNSPSGDRLDVRVGDVLVYEIDGVVKRRSILHALGNLAVVNEPLHTHAPFDTEAAEFRRNDSGRAALLDNSPYVFIPATRYRDVRVGDRLIPLPEITALPPGWSAPAEGEAYTVSSLEMDGLAVRQVNESDDALPRTYARFVVWPGNEDPTTSLFSVKTRTGGEAGLMELERTARRLKDASDPDTQLDDIWPLRSVTFFVDGSPVDARRSWDDMVRLSTTKPVETPEFLSEVRGRLDEESRRGTLLVSDAAVQIDSGVVPAEPLGSAAHSLLGSNRLSVLASGTLPAAATDGTTAPVQYVDPMTGEYVGPVTRGGAREFGWWAWATWKLRVLLETPPDFQELKEDIGRAYADMGVTKGRSYAGTLAEIVDIETNQVRIEFTDYPPNPSLIEGTDFSDGAASDPPIRIVSVDSHVEVVPGTVTEATVTLTEPTTAAASAPVAIVSTTVAQAWQEILKLVTFLDTVEDILSQLVAPQTRVVAAAAQRLDAAGYDRAADVVRSAKFSEWSDSSGLSERGVLAERLETLVSSLLSRRRSPLDE